MPLTMEQYQKSLAQPPLCEQLKVRDLTDGLLIQLNGSFVAGYRVSGIHSYYASDEERNRTKLVLEALIRSLPCRQPSFPSLCLALGAVPVSARVVGNGLIIAARALVAMSTQGSGAAALNGTKGLELLEIQARSIPVKKTLALGAEDVSHLHGGPSQGFFLRWY